MSVSSGPQAKTPLPNDATPTRKRRSSGDARHAILDAAEVILARDGVDRVLLKPVAEAAGITHSGVLHHFGSRTGLLEALFQRASARMRAEILDTLGGLEPGMSMNDAVDAFVDLYSRVAEPSRAPILAWLIACHGDPLPVGESFGLAEIADRIHAVRRQINPRADAADTRFRVELATLTMFGDLLVGASTRARLGAGDTAHARRRFRERLGHILLAGLEPPPA